MNSSGPIPTPRPPAFPRWFVLAALVFGSAVPALARQGLDRFAVQGIPLADALRFFAERTGSSVAFDPALVRGKTAWCVTASADTEARLRCLLDGTGLEFFRRASGTYVIGPRMEIEPAYGRIAGRIVDRESGAPLPGANVLLAGVARGAAADGSGRFHLDRLLPGRYVLTVTHLGFSPWQDSLFVAPGAGTLVDAGLRASPLVVRPLVVEADRAGGDPWLAADRASSLEMPAGVDRSGSVAARLADRAGVTLSDAGADARIQGGVAADVALRLDGVPLFVPRSIASFVGAVGAAALDRITIHGAGFEASGPSATGGVLDFRHALTGRPGIDVQLDPYAFSGRARFSPVSDSRVVQGLVSWRHGLGAAMLPRSLGSMLRDWSGPDPFLLVAPLGRYDLATPGAIGYATGLFVPATPTLGFDDLHLAARYRPRPVVSWDASAHLGNRRVGGNRLAAERVSDSAVNDRPLFSSVDAYDWSSRMAQIRHERVLGTRVFLTAQAWVTRYELDHRYRLADRIALRSSDEVFALPESSPGEARDGNAVDAWGLTGRFSYARGRHDWSGGVEVGRTSSAFDLRLASVAAGSAGELVVPISNGPGSEVSWETASVFMPRHARVSNRATLVTWAAHLSDRINLGRLTLEPGIRTTVRPERTTVYAEPRLRAAWSPRRAVSITASGGLYRQFTGQYDLSSLNAGAFFPSTRVWLPSDATQRPPRSANAAAAITWSPVRHASVVADAWVKDHRHLHLFNYAVDPALLVDGARLDQATLLTPGRGLDRGLGISAGWEAARWTARLRYERSSSWRSAASLFSGRRVPTPGHAPHRVSFGIDAAPASSFDLGLRAVAQVGRTWAFRPVYYDYFGHDGATARHLGYDFSNPGAHRLPALVTVDGTAAWAVALGPVRAQFRIEVLNILDRRNELDRILLWDGAGLRPSARYYPGRTAAGAIRVSW